MKMTIREPQRLDWQNFFELADNEGWRVPQIEQQLLQEGWAHCVHVLDVDGAFGGLVSAVAHERSGWIGNLIVPQAWRRQGLGTKLFLLALDNLASRGMTSCWLTASDMGLPLYEKSGFRVVDQVERWVYHERKLFGPCEPSNPDDQKALYDFDLSAWGEDRSAFLSYITGKGRTFACDSSVALLQQGTDMQILGPWYSRTFCPVANRRVLEQVLSAADPAVEVVVDTLSSSPIRQILAAASFTRIGSNRLMVKGNAHATDLKMMVSLASLGSVG